MKKQSNSIIIENKHLRLTLGDNGIAKSLISVATGEECLDQNELLPMFSLVEERPFNNEIKLAHPNKRMTFGATHVECEGDTLTVSFELVRFKASVRVVERDDYITFELVDFPMDEAAFGNLWMDRPPVASFRLLQLPIRKREKFGNWLNVVSDDTVAINVLGTSPYESIDAREQKGAMILTADAVREVKLKGTRAALITCHADKLLDCIETLEIDFDLPRGVAGRRADYINRSLYWTMSINPTNVDKNIEYAKQCGLQYMLIYYPAIFKEKGGEAWIGNYEYQDCYEGGVEGLRKMLDKIKAAGITPGFHVLHTHIGVKSKYVTPVCDHRLRLKEHFTLSRPLGTDDTTIYVEENPQNAPMWDKCRILRFGGELVTYESFSTEYPYCFKGVERGAYKTNIVPHELGQIGGVMDFCEFTAASFYLDQNSDIQDEIAEKLAECYNAGFEFLYFDGSEGVNPPYDFHVSNAQYRVLKKLNSQPLFSEGAAKTHFGWHYISGGNAFDVFPAPIFKEKIVEHPFEEAPRMAQDFTRLNFGWWIYYDEMMPDMYEYGNALAYSWDCPATIRLSDSKVIEAHPRTKDNFEVMRRWEEARVQKFITPEQKMALRNTAQEHILLINEEGEYELCPYDCIKGAGGENAPMSAYIFTRRNKNYVVLWHTKGEGKLSLPLPTSALCYEDELGGEKLPLTEADGNTVLTVNDRHYLSTTLDRETIMEAFKDARSMEE